LRVRVRFSKEGKIRWTSHRDVARMWERAFRRVDLPLAYTEGFSPRPKVSFGLALSTGHESMAEYLDFELADGASVEMATLPARLTPVLPTGIDVLVTAVAEDRAPSLQEDVTSCTWSVKTADTLDFGQLTELVDRALAAGSIVITRQRKGRLVTDDIRPGILHLEVVGDGHVLAELATHPRGLKPSEMLAGLARGFEGGSLEEGGVRRLHQWIQRDGARQEPLALPADATDAPRALERVS
jgi:radical SAM-linked protein